MPKECSYCGNEINGIVLGVDGKYYCNIEHYQAYVKEGKYKLRMR